MAHEHNWGMTARNQTRYWLGGFVENTIYYCPKCGMTMFKESIPSGRRELFCVLVVVIGALIALAIYKAIQL